MHVSEEVEKIVDMTVVMAKNAGFELIVPELMLYVICKNKVFAQAFENCGGNVRELDYHLRTYIENYMEYKEEMVKSEPQLSQDMKNVLERVRDLAQDSGKDVVELPHLLFAIYELEESYAVYYMLTQGVEQTELIQEMTILYEEGPGEDRAGRSGGKRIRSNGNKSSDTDEREDETEGEDEPGDEESGSPRRGRRNRGWEQYAVCLNDMVDQVNPLIGREEELERTMQILCRRDKNNPLHIGEPGVGKTAITYGLARLLEEGRGPEPLRGARIFSLDLGSLLAGTQYRGDFEKRFKKVMDGICRQEKPILYIDEIHNIVGAGAVNGGTFDISNMLKPYLERGQVRFIGATTYEEYKKHFEKSKSLVRRFRNIDIKEPDIQDCVS
ncbi:MAG: AAA family ATPase, partial [Acetatifactor sp.]|nr:AAA family ATPase [Acetatifactor sp.]